MTPLSRPSRLTTAIPARYHHARERVLRILARWEESTRQASGWHLTSPEGAKRPVRP